MENGHRLGGTEILLLFLTTPLKKCNFELLLCENRLLQNIIFQKHDMSYSIGTKTRIFYYLVRLCTVINSSTNFIIYCALCREFRCSVNMCIKKVFCLVTQPAVSAHHYKFVKQKESQTTLYFIQAFKVNKYLWFKKMYD